MPQQKLRSLVFLAIAAFAVGLAFGEYGKPAHRVRGLVFGQASAADNLRDAGSWHKAREVQSGNAGGMPSSAIAQLPYVGGSVGRDGRDIVEINDPSAAYNGVTLIVSGHAPEATLVDMKGNVLHTWRYPVEEVWPGPLGFEEFKAHKTFWRRAHLFDNGDLLAVFEGIGMIKLDKESKLLWENKGRFHHDLWVGEDGRIYGLTRTRRTEHPDVEVDGSILEDSVVVLSADGVEEQRVSILDCFLHSDYASVLSKVKWRGDVLHTNTIEVMSGEWAERVPMFAKGRVLISSPSIDTIAVLDLEQGKVVWAAAGMWRFQHQPTVLPGGNLLLFDNLGNNGKSKVIELDPLTLQIVWAYRGTEDDELFSSMLGSCARLPNGNTLITESTTGRAIEVTQGGEIVWDYNSPYQPDDDPDLVASLFEAVRFDLELFRGKFPELFKNQAPEGDVDVKGVGSLLKKFGKGKGEGEGKGEGK